MGRRQEYVEDVSCRSMVAMVGMDQFITKDATLMNEKEVDAHPVRVLKCSVSLVVLLLFNARWPLNIPKLVEGFKCLEKSDPMVVCTIEESGE